MIDLSTTRALADAATPGKWDGSGRSWSHDVAAPWTVDTGPDTPRIANHLTIEDAAHIAHNDPDHVRAMCDEIEMLRGLLARAADTLGELLPDCTTPAYGAPGHAHCAACCYGSMKVADGPAEQEAWLLVFREIPAALLREVRGGLLAPITLKKGLTGAKPEAFCRWVLDLLNFQPGDTLDDLFPGTGVMGRMVELVSEGATDDH